MVPHNVPRDVVLIGVASPSSSYVPRINPACNIRGLAISPHEAFVLSRIDGYCSASDLGLMTGLGDAILPLLSKLFSMGALTEAPPNHAASAYAAPRSVPTPSGGPVSAQPAGGPPSSGGTGSPPSSGNNSKPPSSAGNSAPVSARGGPPSSSKISSPSSSSASVVALLFQEEMSEDVELDAPRRLRILKLFHTLSEVTHYELLGVEPSADKKAIKKAYFDLAQEFHPDRYFRKNLGSFKSKLEVLFKRITEAHDVLTRNQSRSEYDAELATRQARPPSKNQLQPLRLPLTNAPNLPVSKTPSVRPPPPSMPPPAPLSLTSTPAPPSVRPAATSTPHVPSVRPPPPTSMRPGPPDGDKTPSGGDSDESRRRALASRLSGKWGARASNRPPPPPSVPPGEPANPDAANARESLRRMAVSRQAEQHRGQVERYVQVAQECAQRSDPVGAANAYRLALSLEPNNEQLQALTREWASKAAVMLVDHYVKLGNTEADHGRWPEAVRAFLRAAAGRPDDPAILDRAAHALARADGDLHQALDLARKAVAMKPNSLRFRLTLTEVYIAANLTLNARRELTEAAKIDPEDKQVKALQKQLG